MRIGLILFALPLASCAVIPSYDDPKRVARIEGLREARDVCLVQNVRQFDDGISDAAKIGNAVAVSCSAETTKLVDLAIPDPSPHTRAAFQQQAAYRATGYVLTARRIEIDAVDRQRPQQPAPPRQ